MLRRQFLIGSLGSLGLAAGGATRHAWSSPARDIADDGPVVKTRQGSVRGSAAGGVYVFKGIPFAAAPFGVHRLRPPQPAEPWEGVRETVAFGPKSPQTPYPPIVEAILPELTVPGEDCLNLNIWTPDIGSAGLPVMVWIAGGLFEYHGTGASPWYDGSHFARDGIVCVTINYRVGAEGFLYLSDGVANLGLLDQIAALEWVRENIAAFGGDPGNVTVFGESAGALSIGTLLSMPRAAGLFRRVILESGGAHHVSTADTAGRIGRRLAEKLGVGATRDAIASVPVDRLLQAQAELRNDMAAMLPDPVFWGEVALTNLPWQPAIDGDVIPERPIDRIVAGAGADTDLLLGANTDETRLFLVTAGAIDHITPEALAAMAAAYGLPAEAALTAYRELHPGASPGDLLSAIQTDWYWRIPTLRVADAHATNARSSPTYMYEFAWRGSPQFAGRLGAGHSMEIPFVFDTLGNQTEPLHGPNPPQALADTMHRAWVSFVATGDPGWPKYDLVRRATMHFDTTPAVVDDPLAGERKIWEGIR
jgi:carboxylesterase 2/para-nitrobenzyl esterase